MTIGGPRRRKLPDERHALTHKFDIAGHEGRITVGLFEDGMPGEISLVMAKEGSTISGPLFFNTQGTIHGQPFAYCDETGRF